MTEVVEAEANTIALLYDTALTAAGRK